MENELTAKRVAYDWFRERYASGNPVAKDIFLYDRVMWDSMQSQLIEAGENLEHDDVKELVRRLDKGGWLGGIGDERTFDEQMAYLEAKRKNLEETGHPDGTNGIIKDVGRWSECQNDPKLEEYYKTNHWSILSRNYRSSVGWTCELCLKAHPAGSGDLVTHHLTYKRPDGSCILYHETDRELMAVCAKPCHQLADIARYLAVGRISQEDAFRAMEPLLYSVRGYKTMHDMENHLDCPS